MFLVSYEEQAITYVWKNDEDTLRKSPSLTTLNAYLIKNATGEVCCTSKFRIFIRVPWKCTTLDFQRETRILWFFFYINSLWLLWFTFIVDVPEEQISGNNINFSHFLDVCDVKGNWRGKFKTLSYERVAVKTLFRNHHTWILKKDFENYLSLKKKNPTMEGSFGNSWKSLFLNEWKSSFELVVVKQ